MLETKFFRARQKTEELCSVLETEDYVVQPMAEVSPPKWHLGHTTWFLEELILNKVRPHYQFYHPGYRKLFNSYYKGLGEHWVQGERGRLSRPSVKEIYEYRKHIDEQVLETYQSVDGLNSIIELAINHEEQHQELLLMDIKNILGANPLSPSYGKPSAEINAKTEKPKEEKWIEFREGLYSIGADRSLGFAFDNETPVHKVYLHSFALSDHMVTNAEFMHFIEDRGYQQPKLWLSKGWDWVNQQKITAPLYWRDRSEFTLHGERPLDPSAPVSHISYFEADAFARWMGMRLPTEAEFEVCETEAGHKKNHHPDIFQPLSAKTFESQLWCWTSSHYSPYPGFTPFEGDIEEYNGKFMCNQFIMKGGCFATPEGHYRKTYRNFYEPDQRWMFSGIALAKDIK